MKFAIVLLTLMTALLSTAHAEDSVGSVVCDVHREWLTGPYFMVQKFTLLRATDGQVLTEPMIGKSSQCEIYKNEYSRNDLLCIVDNRDYLKTKLIRISTGEVLVPAMYVHDCTHMLGDQK